MWHAQASNTFVDHTQKKLRLGDWGLGEFYFPNKIYKVSLFVLNKGCSHVLCTILVGALNPWLLSLIHSSNAKNCKQALHVLCVSFSLSHTVSIYLSHTHTHSLSLSLTHTHTHTNTHKYKYTHKHTQIQIHTHKHTHTHIHTCMCNTQVDKQRTQGVADNATNCRFFCKLYSCTVCLAKLYFKCTSFWPSAVHGVHASLQGSWTAPQVQAIWLQRWYVGRGHVSCRLRFQPEEDIWM